MCLNFALHLAWRYTFMKNVLTFCIMSRNDIDKNKYERLISAIYTRKTNKRSTLDVS